MKTIILTICIIIAELFSQDSITIRVPVGNILYAKHLGVTQHPIMGGLDGPWQQFCPAERNFGSGVYFADLDGRKVYLRDSSNVVRKVAGTGYAGPCLEGSADQSYFFFGLIGGYSGGGPTTLSDAKDESYINDTEKYRRLYLDANDEWQIRKWYGYGNGNLPSIGDTVSISSLRSIDGNLRIDRNGEIGYMVPLGHGLCKLWMKENKITTLIGFDTILARSQVSFYQENMGDARIAIDGKYYFTVNRSACMLRYDTALGTLERYISGGANSNIRGVDGHRLESGFFATAFKIPLDPTVIFSGGGDEGYIRRIYQDTVKHMMSNASWQIMQGRGSCFNVPQFIDETTTGNLVVSTGEHGVGYTKLAFFFDEYKETKIPSSKTYSEKIDEAAFSQAELSVYPNPFNPTITIRLRGLNNKDNTIGVSEFAIYGVGGQKIADFTTTGSKLVGSSGTVSVEWNGSKQASGTYLVRVRAGNKLLTKKILLAK